MWISRKRYDELVDASNQIGLKALMDLSAKQAQVSEVERMNTRLQADLDWAKHRLNQVERERAQLIASAIGVKVAVPEFVPTYRPDEALNEGSDPFRGVGEDSPDPEHQLPQADGVDYSMMPGFRGK